MELLINFDVTMLKNAIRSCGNVRDVKNFTTKNTEDTERDCKRFRTIWQKREGRSQNSGYALEQPESRNVISTVKSDGNRRLPRQGGPR